MGSPERVMVTELVKPFSPVIDTVNGGETYARSGNDFTARDRYDKIFDRWRQRWWTTRTTSARGE